MKLWECVEKNHREPVGPSGAQTSDQTQNMGRRFLVVGKMVNCLKKVNWPPLNTKTTVRPLPVAFSVDFRAMSISSW